MDELIKKEQRKSDREELNERSRSEDLTGRMTERRDITDGMRSESADLGVKLRPEEPADSRASLAELHREEMKSHSREEMRELIKNKREILSRKLRQYRQQADGSKDTSQINDSNLLTAQNDPAYAKDLEEVKKLNAGVRVEEGAKKLLNVSAYRFMKGYNEAEKKMSELANDASWEMEFPGYAEKKANKEWEKLKEEAKALRKKDEDEADKRDEMLDTRSPESRKKYLLRRWSSSEYTQYKGFMIPGDHEKNTQIMWKCLYGKGKALKDLYREYAREVLNMEFSLYMQNSVWAGENAGKLWEMVYKCKSLENLRISREKDLEDEDLKDKDSEDKDGLSREEEGRLDTKIRQANNLMELLKDKMVENGLRYDYYDGVFEVDTYIKKKKDIVQKAEEHEHQRNLGFFQMAQSDEQDHILNTHAYTQEDYERIKTRAKPRKRAVLPKEIQKLSFMDFADMVGKKNRGQVEYLNGKLTIVNNGYFQRNRIGADAEIHVQIKQQFVEVALLNLKEEDREAYRPYLLSMVGLEGDTEKTKPLTRKQIAAVLQEVETHPSLVKKAAITQSNERIKANANKVLNFFGEPIRKSDYWPTRWKKRRAIRNKMRSVLAKVRKSRDLISENRLNYLINNNMDALLDEIFRSVMRMENAAYNLTGKGNPEMESENPACLEKFAEEAILKLAAGSENLNIMADYRLNENIYAEAFRLAGKEDILKAMEQGVISGFTGGTEQSFLQDFVEQEYRLLGQRTEEELVNGLGAFTLLINESEKLRKYHTELLQRTAAKPSFTKDEMLETVYRIQALMEDNKEIFDKIAGALQTTRYGEGYRVLKERIEKKEFSAENEEKIANALFTEHEDRIIQPLFDEGNQFRTLNGEEEQIYRSLSGEEKKLADILLLRGNASDYLPARGGEDAQNIMDLLERLKNLDPESKTVIMVRFGKVEGKLIRSAKGRLTLTLGEKELPLPVSVKGLSDVIEVDMCSAPGKYGIKNIDRLIFQDMRKISLSWKYYQSDYSLIGEMDHDREIASRLLMSIHPKIKGMAYFENLSTMTLMDLALRYLNEQMGIKSVNPLPAHFDVLARLKVWEKEALKNINGAQTLRAMQLLERVDKDEIPVRMPEQKEEEAESGDTWTAEERKIRDFIANIYLGNTADWDQDWNKRSSHRVRYVENSFMDYRVETVEKQTEGEYYVATLLRDVDTFRKLMEDPSLLTKTVEKMSLPASKEGRTDLKTELMSSFTYGLLNLSEKLNLKGLSNDEIRARLQAKENKDVIREVTKTFDEQIKNGITKCANAIQEEMTDAAKTIFAMKKTGREQIDLSKYDLHEKKISAEEKQRRLALHNKELTRRIEEAVKSDGGQGDFLKEMISGYFLGANEVDQRSMLSSMIRGTMPKKELPEDATEEEKAEEELRRKGNVLSGYLKGAGPLLQKFIQGLPEQGLPPVLRIAAKDMKSKLSPISETMVEARLLSMIQRSKGEVTAIDVEKSLGAASIGQAFLCRFYGPQLPEEGKEVVVKLLRPEARNRMARESELFRSIAKKMDKKNAGSGKVSNKQNLKGQTEAFLAELDLTMEAKNAQMGSVYNNGTDVESVNVINLVMPTTNALVLEKAPGTTVDRYRKETKEKMTAIMTAWKNGSKTAEECRTELLAELNRLEKRQDHLAGVASQWVNEAIYGHGFYHGDLHAGNIMIDDDKATVIDFGNVTRLSDQQKDDLTKLTAAAAAGETDDYFEAFHSLLPEDAQAKLMKEKDRMKTEIRDVFKIGNRESAGLRIALLIMKAQSMGIQVPPVIIGFSNSQIRVQNTLDEMCSLIGEMKSNLAAVEKEAGVKLTKEEQEARNKKPKRFFKVMTEVLIHNMGISLKRLGYWKSLMYRNKLKQ